MTIITADATLQAVLGPLQEEAEIRDTSGKILGRFIPALSAEEEEAYARAAELFDLEELDRIAKTEGKGRPFEAMMRRLKALENLG